MTLRGLRREYDEVFLPLYGAHQAQNAALALAAAEAARGRRGCCRTSWCARASRPSRRPGRLEVVRRGPTILLDAAHNPHGAAALVEALRDSFTSTRWSGWSARWPTRTSRASSASSSRCCREIVCTQNSTRPLDAGRGARRGGARPVRRAPGARGAAPRRRARARGDAGGDRRRARRVHRLRVGPGHRVGRDRGGGPGAAGSATAEGREIGSHPARDVRRHARAPGRRRSSSPRR